MNKLNVKALTEKLNFVATKNLGKVFFAMFLMIMVESLVSGVVVFALVRIPSVENLTSLYKAIILGITFILSTVSFLFQTGLLVLTLKMVREEFVTIGFVFYGFRKIKKFLPLALINSLLVSFIFGIYKLISFLLKPQLKILEDKLGLVVLVSIFIGIILLSVLFVLVNFIFVTQIKYDNPEMNAFKCFIKSFVLMKGNVFRFFSFVIRSCGINLVLALFYFGMSLSMNSVKNNFSSILSFVFDFLYFINIYKAAGRLYFTFPVAYTSLIENNDLDEVLEA